MLVKFITGNGIENGMQPLGDRVICPDLSEIDYTTQYKSKDFAINVVLCRTVHCAKFCKITANTGHCGLIALSVEEARSAKSYQETLKPRGK